MGPNERACMTSYPSVIVNLAVSASVSKLRPSKICMTSILTSQGHSRSKAMVSNERGHMTYYSSLLVSLAAFASVSSYSPRNLHDLDFDLSRSH